MSRMTIASLRSAAALGGVAVLIAGLVACAPAGASQKEGGVASGSSQSSEKSLDDWRLAYAKCMREQGIDYPDPSETSGSQVLTMDDAMEEAAAVCENKLGKPPVQSGSGAKPGQNPQLELATCLRERGYDMEDPESESSMLQIPEGLTAEDAEACGLQGFGE